MNYLSKSAIVFIKFYNPTEYSNTHRCSFFGRVVYYQKGNLITQTLSAYFLTLHSHHAYNSFMAQSVRKKSSSAMESVNSRQIRAHHPDFAFSTSEFVEQSNSGSVAARRLFFCCLSGFKTWLVALQVGSCCSPCSGKSENCDNL